MKIKAFMLCLNTLQNTFHVYYLVSLNSVLNVTKASKEKLEEEGVIVICPILFKVH